MLFQPGKYISSHAMPCHAMPCNAMPCHGMTHVRVCVFFWGGVVPRELDGIASTLVFAMTTCVYECVCVSSFHLLFFSLCLVLGTYVQVARLRKEVDKMKAGETGLLEHLAEESKVSSVLTPLFYVGTMHSPARSHFSMKLCPTKPCASKSYSLCWAVTGHVALLAV